MQENEKDNINEQDDNSNGQENDINNRELSSTGRSALKTPITSLMNKLFGNKKRRHSFSKLVPIMGIKFKLILICAIIFIIFIVAIIIVIGEDSSESAVNTRANAIESFNINESSSKIEQEALKLYNTYDSLIAFNNDQINAIYQSLKDSENSTNKYLIDIGKSNFGDSSSENDIYTYKYKRELYEHILRTEKYNFNQIVWKEYSHDADGTLINKEKNTDLGLLVPEKTDEDTLVTILDTTAPYLLTNDIPLGMLSGTYNLSTSNNYQNSVAAKFTYEILKESLTKLIVNKYVVESIKFNTSYDDYDTLTYSGTYTVKYNGGNIYLVSAPNYQQVGEAVTHRTEERKISEDIISEDIYWYVQKAQTYDANINNVFNYEKYNESDVLTMTNPDTNNLISSVEINRINGDKITDSLPENIKAQVANMALNAAFAGIDPDSDGGYTFTLTSTYTQDVGYTYTYEKEWRDTLSPSQSNNNVYKYDDMVNYNTKEFDEEYKDIETDRKIIDEQTFKNSTSEYKKYEEPDTTVLYGLSIIDFIDSNKGTYSKYVSSLAAAKSEYEGLGRYEIREGYNQIKYILNRLIKKEDSSNNILPFVYGSSLGYEVTNISMQSANASNYISGMDLLREYIRSFEGAGEQPVTANADGVECYTAYNDSGGKLTIGYGVNLDAHPDDKASLESQIGQAIDVGTLVPVELVDSIEEAKIKEVYDRVKATTNGLELKEYQLHALTSLLYNGISIDKILIYYTDPNYWNEETDDKYEEVYEKYKENQTAVSQIEAEADMTRGLYTNWLALNVHDAAGNRLPGLERRRRSEYILFSLGYYNTLQTFYTSGGIAPSGDVLVVNGQFDEAACLNLQTWFEANIFAGKLQGASPDLRAWKNVAAGSSSNFNSAAYGKYATGSSYAQCPWWSRIRANMYLEQNGHELMSGPTGNGWESAQKTATEYLHINYYSGDQMDQLRANAIISFAATPRNSAGHVAYVEAVTDTEYIISHCGSGKSWHGLLILPKTKNHGISGVGQVVGFCNLDEAI